LFSLRRCRRAGGNGALYPMTESRTWPKPGWIFFLVAALIFSFDVFTKHLVLEHLLPGQRIEVIPGFLNWTYVTNDGIAFGLFQGKQSPPRNHCRCHPPIRILDFP
jgi:hypothetical protein